MLAEIARKQTEAEGARAEDGTREAERLEPQVERRPEQRRRSDAAMDET